MVIFKSQNREKCGKNTEFSVFAEPGRPGIKTITRAIANPAKRHLLRLELARV
jgi:hypothetical protein